MTKIITKYFDDGSLSFIKSGSFKFGTLEEYRAKEVTQSSARMSDPLEARIPLSFGSQRPGGEKVSMTVGTMTFEDCSFVGSNLFGFTPAFNQWVFCSSIGKYDLAHHRIMLCGKGNYKGNPELKNWVEIDLEKFLSALKVEVSKEMTVQAFGSEVLHHAKVKYNKGQLEIPVRRGVFDIKSFGLELAAAFTKPAEFSVEMEYRILARLFAPNQAPLSAAPRAFRSDGLRESILDVGRISQD